MVFIQFCEEVSKLRLLDRRHVFYIAISKLFPANVTISIQIHTLKFALELPKHLILHEVMGDKDHDCRLKLIHFAKSFYRLELVADEQLFISIFVAEPYPRVIEGVFGTDPIIWVISKHFCD